MTLADLPLDRFDADPYRFSGVKRLAPPSSRLVPPTGIEGRLQAAWGLAMLFVRARLPPKLPQSRDSWEILIGEHRGGWGHSLFATGGQPSTLSMPEAQLAAGSWHKPGMPIETVLKTAIQT